MRLPLSALVCPDCRVVLSEDGANLRCAKCAAVFSLGAGIPNFYPPSRKASIEAELTKFKTHHGRARNNSLLRALIPPNPICDPGGRLRYERVRGRMASGVVLNLGSKTSRWGEHVLNVDLAAPEGGGIDMLCDISALPFADGSVDGVICTYVLEHVADARACVAEIARVLKPGGAVFVAVPFLFPFHPDPLDRWRWTLDGLRETFAGFSELEAGCSGGPFSAYVAMTPGIFASFFSNFYLFNAVRFALGWGLWPLKFLDYLCWKNERAQGAAANFYFFGTKK